MIATEAMIGQILKIINKKSPQHLEGVSRKLKQWLSPTHYILQEIQMSLIALYQQKNEKPGKSGKVGLIVQYLVHRENSGAV